MFRKATPWGTRKLYEFIAAHQKSYDVRTMFNALSVSRSGFYAWPSISVSRRAEEDARSLRLSRASFRASHGV